MTLMRARAALHTRLQPVRDVTVHSMTADGGEVVVPYLRWAPGDVHPCEAMLLPIDALTSDAERIPCGLLRDDPVHEHHEGAGSHGPHHPYLAHAAHGGMWLWLDDRFGLKVPSGASDDEAEALVQFIAEAIAIGAGYPSIAHTKRKVPFRG